MLCSNSRSLRSPSPRQLWSVASTAGNFCLFVWLFFFFMCFLFTLLGLLTVGQTSGGQTDAARRLHLSDYRGSCVWSHEIPPPPPPPPSPSTPPKKSSPPSLWSDFKPRCKREERSVGASGCCCRTTLCRKKQISFKKNTSMHV